MREKYLNANIDDLPRLQNAAKADEYGSRSEELNIISEAINFSDDKESGRLTRFAEKCSNANIDDLLTWLQNAAKADEYGSHSEEITIISEAIKSRIA